MNNTLRPLFQEILLHALPAQIERERNKVVDPRKWHPETYLEHHENRDELQMSYNEGYGRGRF
jgi:hypothetical protein